MVPVDICINLLVCIAWQTAKQTKGSPIKVYNCTSGGINPVTWGQVEVWGLDAILDVAYEGALWYPGGCYQENWRMNRLLQLAFHYGPAQIVDLGCRLVGQKPFLVKVSEMMQKSTKALEPFTTGSWTWTSSNTKALGESLTEEDRETFGFDIRAVHWPSYLKVYAQGIRDFLFKEDPASQAACRRKLIFLWLLDWLVKGGFVLLLLWTFLKCFL
jgi:fatty acyl-CoA reductase